MNALRLFLLLSPALLLAGCDAYQDGGGEKGEPAQTELLRVEVIPNPVVASDTALFRATIKDSLDKRFRYEWTRSLGEFVGVGPRYRLAITDTNSVRWVAPNELGTFGFTVSPDNGSRDSLATGGSFSVTVVSGD